MTGPMRGGTGPIPSGGGTATATSVRLVGLADDVATVLATSASGHFARDPRVPSLIRARGRGWVTDVADAIASPPTGWAWLNSGNAASAAISSGTLSIVAGTGGNYDWYTSTRTAPLLYRDVTITSADQWFVARFRHVGANQDFEGVRLVLSDASTTSVDMLIDLGFASGTAIRVLGSSSVLYSSTVTAEQWAWYAIRLVGSMIHVYRSTATDCPTTISGWGTPIATTFAGGTGWPNYRTASLRFGLAMVRSGSVTGSYSAECTAIGTWEPGLGLADFAAGGYAATSDTLVLADLDYEADVTPDIAAIRLALADAENRRPDDAGTWTYSLTGGATATPAEATTYQSAATLTLKAGGSDTTQSAACRYWTLRARMASASSAQPGSLDTALIRLPAAT